MLAVLEHGGLNEKTAAPSVDREVTNVAQAPNSVLHHGITLNIRGNSHRLEEKFKAGLIRGEEALRKSSEADLRGREFSMTVDGGKQDDR